MRKKKDMSPQEPDSPKSGQQRLQRILAAAGIDSRRKCEALILEGAVTVNGEVVNQLPAFADPEKDDIRVHGERIRQPEKCYFLLNKPKNVICTSYDPLGRRQAVDLIPCNKRIVCAGRLDADTTGALLLTNDTELVHQITHPSFKVPKTYEVEVNGRMESQHIEKLKKGIWLSEGKTAGAGVKVLRRTNLQTSLEITIKQGLNRQIRRSFAKLGFKVKSLKRTKLGNLSIKGIPLGGYQELTIGHIKGLLRSCPQPKGALRKPKPASEKQPEPTEELPQNPEE
jgi:23S rRNA pseudouridine2605 synthase